MGHLTGVTEHRVDRGGVDHGTGDRLDPGCSPTRARREHPACLDLVKAIGDYLAEKGDTAKN